MIMGINVHLTNDCQFDCEVCFENKNKLTPSYIDKTKLLKFINDMKPVHVGFVGGEPLLHPDIKEILTALKDYDTCIVTNGEDLASLTDLPTSLSIGLDNDNQDKVDAFLATVDEEYKAHIELTITPTDIVKADRLLSKYKDWRINISLLAFWDKNPNVKKYIIPAYINWLMEISTLANVSFFGENDEHYLRMFYGEYVPEDAEFECMAPLNIYSDGHLEYCDLEYFPTGMTIENYDKKLLVKEWSMQDQCKCCNLRRKKNA